MVVISIIEDDISDIISHVSLEKKCCFRKKIEWRSDYITPSDTTTRQTCHTARTGPLTGHAFSG